MDNNYSEWTDKDLIYRYAAYELRKDFICWRNWADETMFNLEHEWQVIKEVRAEIERRGIGYQCDRAIIKAIDTLATWAGRSET